VVLIAGGGEAMPADGAEREGFWMCLVAVSEWILGVSGSHMMFGRVPVGENGNESGCSLPCRLRGGSSNVAGLAGAGAGVIVFFSPFSMRFLRVNPGDCGATILAGFHVGLLSLLAPHFLRDVTSVGSIRSFLSFFYSYLFLHQIRSFFLKKHVRTSLVPDNFSIENTILVEKLAFL